MSYKAVSVYLLNIPYHADKDYSYYLTPDIIPNVTVGSFVSIPFGNSNSHKIGVVVSIFETDKITEFKPVYSVLDDICLSDEELKLAFFMKDRFFCTFGDAVRAILPPDLITKDYLVFKVSDNNTGANEINSTTKLVYLEILNNKTVSMKQLCTKFGDEVRIIVKSLLEKGLIVQTLLKNNANKNKEIVCLKEGDSDYEDLIKRVKGTKQKDILRFLYENGPTEISDLKKTLNSSNTQINALLAKNTIIIQQISEEDESDFQPIDDNLLLTEEQDRAVSSISKYLDQNKANVVLLHGITGSGKTIVIKKTIDKVIREGRQVIILVPEISLTPQTIKFFTSFYKSKVALIHSSLSNKERYETWERIKNGEISICVGTRSAIFAPFNNLGLIVIDEEHEHTYKSEQNPKYNAIEVAKFRCNYNNCLMLLSSATPSVDSYYKAHKGVYKLVEMKERYGKATLPETIISDLRVDYKNGNTSPIGSLLNHEINERLKKKEQSILFVNRRGYNNYVSCGLCGNAIKCPHCSVSLTLHNDTGKYLMCHYCGYRIPVPGSCPECGNKDLIFGGFGTQKIEEELNQIYSEANILRMDADTTTKKDAANTIINDFSSEKADILIGTQMVTKGHNFPNVTLVGVLLADNSLYMNDYRSNEKTFQLITQVIGRAGRAHKKGAAIIQTFSPDNQTILLSASQNYNAFYQNEINLRQSLLFPPFCDIAVFSLTSKDEALLMKTVARFNTEISDTVNQKYKDVPLEIFGPFANPVYKIKDLYKMRYIIKCKNNIKTRKLFSELLIDFNRKTNNKVTMSVDINPFDV